eukprot:CAMPEP_0119191820 /NCGR_PEP_ID=MMETSP1316-20130426/2506_1 /TAXON_ID=41880 /ORGANISM="Pycnococcus provasolii, Strain RCC2336" /LENGTH=322 /DNA_ID=CAMNT_0007186911 /DNA_START=200 /DNA_END=1165 /DNA_ORIENTATION=+
MTSCVFVMTCLVYFVLASSSDVGVMAYDDDSYYYDSYDESPESYYTHKKGYGYDAYYPKFSVWKPWTWKYKKYDAYDYEEHMPDSLHEIRRRGDWFDEGDYDDDDYPPPSSVPRDGDWFDEGDDDDDDYPPPSSVPFIHIPKTGGTSIEDTFHSLGINAGRFAFDEDDNFLPYSTMSVPCSKWHKPPRSYVNGSFCVLRDPYTRMVSEFNYEKRQMGASHTNCTCSDFDKWIHQMYTELKTNPWAHDCHFVPQTTYTSKCDNILIYQQDVNTFLSAHYDITKNQRTISNASPHCLHDHEEDDLCKTTKKFILEEWYRSDYEL